MASRSNGRLPNIYAVGQPSILWAGLLSNWLCNSNFNLHRILKRENKEALLGVKDTHNQSGAREGHLSIRYIPNWDSLLVSPPPLRLPLDEKIFTFIMIC